MKLTIITIMKNGHQMFTNVKTVVDVRNHIVNVTTLLPVVNSVISGFIIIASEKNGVTHVIRANGNGHMRNGAKFENLYHLEKEGA